MTLEKILDTPLLKNTRTISATANAVAWLAAAGLGGSAALMAGSAISRSALPVTLGVGIVSLAATIAVARFAVQRYNPAAYRILRLQGALNVSFENQHRRYQYERRQIVKALRDDLRLIEFREHWTGKGSKNTMTVECVAPQDAILLDGKVAEEDGRVHRWVYPTRPLGRGEVLETAVCQTHIDDVEGQRPFFRQGGGRYKTDEISVIVRFPLEFDPIDVRGAVWNTSRGLRQNQTVGELPITRTENPAQGTVEYSVTAKSVARHHSYGFRWIWRDSPRTSGMRPISSERSAQPPYAETKTACAGSAH